MPTARSSDPDERPFDEALLDRLRQLLAVFQAGGLGDPAHEVFPDIEKDARENYLYFTLPVALNYQRKSEALWASALATYSDPQTRFVFDPQAVTDDPEGAKAALLRHKLALQPERHSKIWTTLSETFAREYDGDPKKLLSTWGWSVRSTIDALRARKVDFPYLNGIKMANYWMYMLSRFTDAPFVDRGEISVIPDVHVKRASLHLGITDRATADDATFVARRWQAGLRGSGIAPCDLHAPLWRWSRASFQPML